MKNNNEEQLRFFSAYSDVFTTAEQQGKRNLNYKSDIWIDNIAAADWYSRIESYNEFDGAKFSKIAKEYIELEFLPAREQSVCVYVRGKEALIKSFFNALYEEGIKPNEYSSIEPYDSVPTVKRFWWD